MMMFRDVTTPKREEREEKKAISVEREALSVAAHGNASH